MSISQFRHSSIPPEAEMLRSKVRAFLRDELADYPLTDRAHSWMGFNAGFSRQLGAVSYTHLTLPTNREV